VCPALPHPPRQRAATPASPAQPNGITEYLRSATLADFGPVVRFDQP
jgi:hypothetical protein